MPEQLSGPDQVEHAAVVDDLDRAAAHHPDVLHRPHALMEDLGAGRMELDLGRLCHPRDVSGLQRVERRVGREEVGDVLQRSRYISFLTLSGGAKILASNWIRLFGGRSERVAKERG